MLTSLPTSTGGCRHEPPQCLDLLNLGAPTAPAHEEEDVALEELSSQVVLHQGGRPVKPLVYVHGDSAGIGNRLPVAGGMPGIQATLASTGDRASPG